LLRLLGVTKMEVADTRATGSECRGGSAGMWSGIGAGVAHQAGWDAGLHAVCVGCRRGKLRPDKRCLRTGASTTY
jgi:hypothetical protein